jgi:DinB family protein
VAGRDLLRAITGQIDVWWIGNFRWRLDGLTDAEYLWEPAANCWTIHPRDDGLVSVDHEWPPPKPAPVTTIAWRMHHIAIGCLANRFVTYFDATLAPSPAAWDAIVEWRRDGPFNFSDVPFPADAQGAVAFLDDWYAAWRRGLDSLGQDGLWRELGPAEYDTEYMQLGVRDPFIGLVLHIHRELMHHGAEISLLRDVYAAQL